MRIGYTCHDVFPATTTNTQQIFWTLLEVADLGHSVDLCVPAVRGVPEARSHIARHYGAPNAAMPERFRIVPLDAGTANDARRAPLNGPLNDGPGVLAAGRVTLSRGRFDLVAPSRFSRQTHDVLWTRDPVALVSAVRRGVPTVFETYRPDYASAPGLSLWRLLTLRKPAFAGVITHSRLAAGAFVAAGVPAERVLVAHNGYAPSLMEPRLSRADARAAVGLPRDESIALYAGHVGPKKGTDALIRLAAAAPDVTIALLGVDENSVEGRWVRDDAQRNRARNVRLLPPVSVASVAAYLYAADCLLVPPTSAPLERFGRTVLPMKLFPYMASGTPILAPRLPDIEEVLEHDRTAVLTPPDDLQAAVHGLQRLLSDRPLAERIGAAAMEEARKYTWSARARTIIDTLERWRSPIARPG